MTDHHPAVLSSSTEVTTPYVPSVELVAEWLRLYKQWIAASMPKMDGMSEQRGMLPPGRLIASNLPAVIKPGEALSLEEFERRMGILDFVRTGVGLAQAAGYIAGREGLPRSCGAYTAPSHDCFGWYNGWATGDFDRRWKAGEVKLPRSPGVTFAKDSSPRNYRNLSASTPIPKELTHAQPIPEASPNDGRGGAQPQICQEGGYSHQGGQGLQPSGHWARPQGPTQARPQVSSDPSATELGDAIKGIEHMFDARIGEFCQSAFAGGPMYTTLYAYSRSPDRQPLIDWMVKQFQEAHERVGRQALYWRYPWKIIIKRDLLSGRTEIRTRVCVANVLHWPNGICEANHGVDIDHG